MTRSARGSLLQARTEVRGVRNWPAGLIIDHTMENKIKRTVLFAAALCFNSAAGRAADLQDLRAADLPGIDVSIPAGAGLFPLPLPARVNPPEDTLPLTAIGNTSELIAASDILIPPNLYQMYIQDGALAVTAYRTSSFSAKRFAACSVFLNT